MIEDQVKFYNEVSKTDPKYVKKTKRNGVAIDAIDPMYQQMLATKSFNGLYGSKWGIKDAEFKTRLYGATEVMTLSGIFWFPGGEFPYSVSEKSFYVSKSGYDIIDVDIEKKLYTSFKSKCLSLLGFNSDIYLNKFSDDMYVSEMFYEHELLSATQLQDITKGLAYYKVDADILLDHFIVSRLAEIPAAKFNEATALIKQNAAGTSKN